ncbi:hypothetical protein [Bacillus salipaludis]|nr:hypothetical protein [Bacillus salipaludis]
MNSDGLFSAVHFSWSLIRSMGGPDEDITRLRSPGRSSGSGFKHSVKVGE